MYLKAIWIWLIGGFVIHVTGTLNDVAVPWIEPETPTPDTSCSCSIKLVISEVWDGISVLKSPIIRLTPTILQQQKLWCVSLFNNSQPFFSLLASLSISLSMWPPFQTYIDSMFVCEILPIIMMNNLEVLSGHDQCVVVVLVVYHQCVPAQSEITFVTTITTINLLISSLVCLSAENHFNVHLSIVTLADLVPEDDLDDDVLPKMRRDTRKTIKIEITTKMKSMITITLRMKNHLCSSPRLSPRDTCNGPRPSIWLQHNL